MQRNLQNLIWKEKTQIRRIKSEGKDKEEAYLKSVILHGHYMWYYKIQNNVASNWNAMEATDLNWKLHKAFFNTPTFSPLPPPPHIHMHMCTHTHTHTHTVEGDFLHNVDAPYTLHPPSPSPPKKGGVLLFSGSQQILKTVYYICWPHWTTDSKQPTNGHYFQYFNSMPHLFLFRI